VRHRRRDRRPWTFGKLIQTSSYGLVTLAFVIGGAIMAAGGIVEILLGVPAEWKPLEVRPERLPAHLSAYDRVTA